MNKDLKLNTSHIEELHKQIALNPRVKLKVLGTALQAIDPTISHSDGMNLAVFYWGSLQKQRKILKKLINT